MTIEPAASGVTVDTGDPAYFAAKAAEQASAENFPVAMRVLPKAVREDLAVFYVFARYVDDLGDEYTGDRVAALSEVDADLGRLASGGTPKLEPVRGLARITADGRVPIEPFHDLVAANLMDQYKASYATFAELVSYCRLSANPVGRVVLHLAGQATPENVADSDAVCTGLQIVEHLQDVAEDRGNGRIYLPREDLTAFGVREEELDWEHGDEDLKALLRWEAGRAAVMLAKGVPLTRRLRGAGESTVAQAFAEAGGDGGGVETTICARDFEVVVEILAEPAAEERAERLTAALREKLARFLYSDDGRTVEQVVLKLYRETSLGLHAARWPPAA